MAQSSTFPFQLVAPPPDWVENGVQGICIGQCIRSALNGNIGRGQGVSWEADAHAHSRIFITLADGDRKPDEHFGWICTQSPESKKHGATIATELGTVETLPGLTLPTLTQPGIIAYHEYAHVLTPTDLGSDATEGHGHGPLWRQTITELGFPEEAERHLQRVHTKKGPARDAGFRAGQVIRIRNSPNILPKYLRGAKAQVLHVAQRYLTLEFEDFKTKINIWPYEACELLP